MPQEVEITPYQSTVQLLRDYGSLFILACLRYMHLHTEKLINDMGGYHPKAASVIEMIQSVTGKRAKLCETFLETREVPPLGDCEEMIGALREFIRRRSEATFDEDELKARRILLLDELSQNFQLTELESSILMACVLIQYDDLYASAWRYVTGMDAEDMPSAGFLLALFDFLQEDPIEAYRCFDSSGSLLKYGLISVQPQISWGEDTPLRLLTVKVPKRIVTYILGEPGNYVPAACRWLSPDREMIGVDKSTDKSIQKQLQKPSAHLALIGYRGLGKAATFVSVAQRMSMPVICLDFADFCHIIQQTGDKPENLFSEVLREIRMKRALLLIDFEYVDSDLITWLTLQSYKFREIWGQDSLLRFAVLLPRQTVLTRQLFGELSEIVFPKPSRALQPQFWTKALSIQNIPSENAQNVAQMLSSGYCLSYQEVLSAVDQTLARLSGKEPLRALTAENISETLNKTRGHALEGMAELRSTHLLLKDIVLSEDIRATLDEILSYARHSETVMQDWGFARYNTSGAGLSVLLSGPPGTGKTLTALVLAHELGRALYVVDLSRVVDKYIGETEKKLAVIFDEAEKSQAMLLFDEADSLFAKRTDVKSSNDRYANLEVNYLLQRLEAYRGVSILTTNFGGGLDEALARRIQFKVHFPTPDIDQRTTLWERLIPPGAPRSDDIDLYALASEFEMSGGHIKNAVFRASIQAVSTNRPIDHELLWNAAVHEYRSMGHIIRDC